MPEIISDIYSNQSKEGIVMCGILVIFVAAIVIIFIDTLVGRDIRKQQEENERIWKEFLKLKK